MLPFLRSSWILLVIGAAYIAGCNHDEPSTSASPTEHRVTRASKPRIVTTVGERGEVIGLLSEGVDPHLYKPTREDVKQLSDADVVFYGGLLLEGRMQESLKKLEVRKPVIGIAESLEQSILRKPPEFEGHYDPHVWMDVKLWSQCVNAITKTMCEILPEHSAEFTSRAEAYQHKLSKLDEYVRQSIASIPEKQRVLVTAHDAFGYFARSYGMEVKSVQGISTDSEAGVADVNHLVDFLVERKIGAIFVESSVSDKSLRAVIEGAGQRNWTVKVGGELFSDAMGASGTYEGTYIGMIDHNATTITRALNGQAPEGGFRSTLEKP